jgi:chromosome segregation ATPase
MQREADLHWLRVVEQDQNRASLLGRGTAAQSQSNQDKAGTAVEYEIMKQDMTKLFETARKQEEMLKVKDAEVDSARTKLIESTALAAERGASLSKVTQEIMALRNERLQATSEIELLKGQVVEITGAAQQQESALKTALAQTSAKNVELEEKVSLTESQLKQCREELHSVVATSAKLDELLQQRDAEFRRAQDEAKAATANCTLAEQRLSVMEEELTVARSALAACQTDLRESQGKASSAMASSNTYEEILRGKEGELMTVQTALHQAFQSEDSLRLNLDQKEREHLHEITRLRAEHEEENLKALKAAEAAEVRAAAAETTLRQRIEDLDKLRLRCGHMEDENRRLMIEAKEANRQARDARIEALSARLPPVTSPSNRPAPALASAMPSSYINTLQKRMPSNFDMPFSGGSGSQLNQMRPCLSASSLERLPTAPTSPVVK